MSDPLPPNLRDLLALHLVPGIGPRLTAALLKRFGSPGAILRASAAELQEVPHIGEKLARSVVDALHAADVDAEVQRMAQAGVRLLALGTPEYPAAVATIPDPPHLLYLRGTLTPADANAVALVGSRSCSDYGRRVATRLAAGLARAGVTVVSGLARGIDGVAHRAALEAGGRTLAVLAGGLARIYPPEHADLAKQVETAGGLLSEAAMSQEPLAAMFPARNRIISGLSRVVVLVEAAQKSGALIIASHAAEQGRPVLAVPGSVESAASGGTHELIRKGAILCRGVEDVLEELHGVSAVMRSEVVASAAPVPATPPAGLDEVQMRVWELLDGQPRHLDELVQRLSLSVPQLTGVLFKLELRKIVRRLAGNRYERCG
jgi:DNA processing protein